jgi:exonuclease VII large subunit
MATFTDDMSTPVTRGELREEFQQFKARLEQSLEQLEQRLEQKLAPLATKTELEIWGGALLARIDSGERRLAEQLHERIASSEQRLAEWLRESIASSEQCWLAALARHTRAIQEAMATSISVIDEKYADLPARVSRLETAVFVPEQR